jgi:hypothetical protein
MSGFVTVACKIPNGLELRVMAPKEEHEQVMGGGSRLVTKYYQTGESVAIKGCDARFGVPIITHGGYALTTGVDKDFWDAWLEQNKETALVKNNLIFAMAREDSAVSKSREMAEIKSGMEPIDPTANHKIGNGMTITEASA